MSNHNPFPSARVLTVALVVVTACAALQIYKPASLDEGWFKVIAWSAPVILLVRASSAASWRDTLLQLGLSRSPIAGILFGLTATLPATLDFLWGIPWTVPGGLVSWLAKFVQPTVRHVASNALAGAFAEEVLFRGFLVSQLVNHAQWPAGRAVAASAIAFGLAHASNGGFLVVFATTIGGGLFGWLFVRWRSLWPGVALHAILNFWWDVDPQVATVWHVPALGLAILLTLWKAPGQEHPEGG